MFDDLIAASSSTYGVPVAWIQAVINVESSWNPEAYRAEPKINDASYGLMQLLGKTAQSLGFSGDVSGLYDPATNIDLGTKLLGQLRASYGDDFQRVYSAYNSGRPDLYLTSAEVAANVQRAVAALETYATEAAQAITQQPGTSAAVAIIVLVLLILWSVKRK